MFSYNGDAGAGVGAAQKRKTSRNYKSGYPDNNNHSYGDNRSHSHNDDDFYSYDNDNNYHDNYSYSYDNDKNYSYDNDKNYSYDNDNNHYKSNNYRYPRSPPQQRTHSRQEQQRQRQPPRPNRNNSSNNGEPSKNPLLLLLISMFGLGVFYLTPISDIMVDIILSEVPIESDMMLGRQALMEFPYPTIHHPRWTPLVRSIGFDLVDSIASSDHEYKYHISQYQWDFGVIDNPQMVNAFALPGGVIRVTNGLLEQLDLTNGELAALIGHEMGHVIHRHSQARIIQRQIVAMVVKALSSHNDNNINNHRQESYGESIGELLIKSADWLGQQSFSRKDEYEADATSWELLIQQSNPYHPKAVQGLLSKIAKLEGEKSASTASWESTHPGTLDRIQALNEKWESIPFQERRLISRSFSTL